jgi:hypothetical protein
MSEITAAAKRQYELSLLILEELKKITELLQNPPV